jgi:hypothetical protein
MNLMTKTDYETELAFVQFRIRNVVRYFYFNMIHPVVLYQYIIIQVRQ